MRPVQPSVVAVQRHVMLSAVPSSGIVNSMIRISGIRNHRVLLPADKADGFAGAADVSLDAAPDRGARQAVCIGAAGATGGEMRCQLPWTRIAHALGGLKAVCYRCEDRTIVQRSKITVELSGLLKALGISMPKQVLSVEETPSAAAAA